MSVDLTPHFAKYELLVGMVDGIFKKIRIEYANNVKCREGCCDCCFALFDLSLIEAIYINHKFHEKFKGNAKEDLLDKANKADRKLYRLKRDAHKEVQEGVAEVEIITRMATERVRCPLLNDREACDLYEYRPITCRIYGVPASNQGMSHTCGKSGFEEKVSYPTINLDTIHQQLYKISNELVKAIKSQYIEMGDMLVPLSMSIVTDYTDEYLGIAQEEREEQKSD